MAAYIIPVEGRTQQDWFTFVTSLNITFNGDRSVSADPSTGRVEVDGVIDGYTALSEE